ncbi:hypothetical protein CXB51_003911 [Gossypium anomalum]|uniref:Glycoside hydrolase family 19 catalytic domain-containing protein n=1 Tax=Gossypium anomalum TaxID=47600 RepID=A0A8J6A121_9ROSI|nr:hypothetical protein CXB51_003911 [Gossypium anomalum]
MSFLQALSVFLLFLSYVVVGSAEQCGRQAGGALCPGGLCCSQFGWCGSTADYCTVPGCQSQCSGSGPAPGPGGLTNMNDGACPASGFYTYDAFLAAARSFPAFATTGDQATRKREIAAFLAQTSHETTGGAGWAAPDVWWFQELQLRAVWKGIGVDLLNNPDLLSSDPTISFKSAFWFWMTPQSPKPSCHNVIIGAWSPSSSDRAAGRVPGYGVITNIINGGLECGKGWNAPVEDRIGFYKRYCDMLGISYGNNLDCYNQRPFGNGVSAEAASGCLAANNAKISLRTLLFWCVENTLIGSAEQCGRQAGGALCPGGLCCSQFGWCGSTANYCTVPGCQSQCSGSGPAPGPGGLTNLISRETFDRMLLHRNDGGCPARGFYTYDAFIAAARSFPAFATTGDQPTRKREIAAFLAQTSHETTGGAGWAAPDGHYAWGYCYNRELNPSPYCAWSPNYPCAPGKQYFGRGPMQLTWNYNYGQCGRSIGVDLLNNPDLLSSDPTISFKSAFWFWMTPQSPKPSCHDVVVGAWSPSGSDQAAGRVPGYGVITNIINGGLECGKGWDAKVEDRIGFYKRYCDMLGVGYGNNLDCYNQRPFGNGVLVDSM